MLLGRDCLAQEWVRNKLSRVYSSPLQTFSQVCYADYRCQSWWGRRTLIRLHLGVKMYQLKRSWRLLNCFQNFFPFLWLSTLCFYYFQQSLEFILTYDICRWLGLNSGVSTGINFFFWQACEGILRQLSPVIGCFSVRLVKIKPSVFPLYYLILLGAKCFS